MYCGLDMFVLIVGCGLVGSAIANAMMEEGHEVSVLDEDAEAIALLDRGQLQLRVAALNQGHTSYHKRRSSTGAISAPADGGRSFR